MNLRSVFDRCVWERKHLGVLPFGRIVAQFRPHECAAAAAWLYRHNEETKRLVRGLWLVSDSLSEVLVVTESPRGREE